MTRTRRAADAALFESGVQAARRQVQQRCKAENNPGSERDDKREREHRGIDGDLCRSRQAIRIRGHECAYTRPRQQQPHCPATEREHATFRDELHQQPPAAGADRSAHGELTMSRLRASEEKIREVRTRNQEHEANGGLQYPDRETRRADDLFLHRLHLQRVTVRREHVILRARPLAPARHERRELSLRLRRGDAVLHSPNQVEEMVSAVLAIRGIELQRHPQLDVVVHDVEAGRHDADDLVLRAVHFDRLPDDVGSRRERRPPQLTGQHDEPRTVCAGLITSKPSSRLRRHTKRLEQLGVDDASVDASRTIRGRHVGLARHVRAD